MLRSQLYTVYKTLMKTTVAKPFLATNVISISAGGLIFVGDAIQQKLEELIGKEYVASLIDDKKVLVISKTSCPHCREAKKLLKSYKIKKECMQILEINNREDMSQIQNYMQQLTGARSVPRVFIDGACIGGGDDTKTMHRTGKLTKLLQEAGVLED